MPEFSNHRALLLPVLKTLADGSETPLADVRQRVAAAEGFTSEQVAEVYASGATKLATQVQFALLGLERAGLIQRVRRAVYRLMNEGEQLLAEEPEQIDDRLLHNYPSFVEWKERVKARRQSQPQRHAASSTVHVSETTPEETMDNAYQEMRAILADEILVRIRDAEPAFLERIVVKLLAAMGYGGGDVAMARVTGGSGDGGIDGTIKEDALGLDEVYIQAKRYSHGNHVGASDVRNFAGALDTAGTNKGVFVATSSFTRSARDYVERNPKRIVLIDGEELARLLVQHDVGVRTRASYKIKEIDEEYFDLEGL